jgi:hypothetical protein
MKTDIGQNQNSIETFFVQDMSLDFLNSKYDVEFSKIEHSSDIFNLGNTSIKK